MFMLYLPLHWTRRLAFIMLHTITVGIFVVFALSARSSVALAEEGSVCSRVTEGLVACYPFNGNANDESGHGKHAIAINMPELSEDRFGRPQRAYKFDGIDDYMDMGDSPLLNPQNAITVSCWFNLYRYKSGRGEEHNLIVKDDFNYSKRDYLLTVNYQAQFVVFNMDNVPGIVNGGSIGLLKWHHVAGTYDGSTIKLYVDGTLSGSRTWNGFIHDTDTSLLIGHTNDSRYDRVLDGRIDDVRIYNRALTEAEIQQLADRAGIVTEPDRLDINKTGRPDCMRQWQRTPPRHCHWPRAGRHSRRRHHYCQGR